MSIPLFDPERDLVTLPEQDAPREPWEERLHRGWSEMLARSAADGVVKPVLPAIAVLHADAERRLLRTVEIFYTCLTRIIERYPRDPELQAFLDLPARVRGWMLRDDSPGHQRVDFCLTAAQMGRIALLHVPPGHVTEAERSDLNGLREQAIRSGREVIMATPAEHARFSRARLAYLRYDTRDIPHAITEWDRFCGRVVSGDIVLANSFAQQWIVDNKLCLAVMSDPRFSHMFDATQRDALRRLVPFSRKLGDGIGERQAAAGRADLVLKEPINCRGRGVHIGRLCSAGEWSDLLRARPGWLIQEYVPAAPVSTAAGTYYRDLWMLIAYGKIAGYNSRVNRTLPINVSHGAGLQAVFGNAALAKRD